MLQKPIVAKNGPRFALTKKELHEEEETKSTQAHSPPSVVLAGWGGACIALADGVMVEAPQLDHC